MNIANTAQDDAVNSIVETIEENSKTHISVNDSSIKQLTDEERKELITKIHKDFNEKLEKVYLEFVDKIEELLQNSN